jgi:hypothetical protein
VNEWDSKGDDYLAIILTEIKKIKNRLVLFSGGPISKILISHAWNIHPYKKNENNIDNIYTIIIYSYGRNSTNDWIPKSLH